MHLTEAEKMAVVLYVSFLYQQYFAEGQVVQYTKAELHKKIFSTFPIHKGCI